MIKIKSSTTTNTPERGHFSTLPTNANAQSTKSDPPNLIFESIEGIARRIPARFQAGFLRAAHGTASPRKAIKAKCYECCGYENVSERVGACSSRKCPIWQYRPHKEKLRD